MVQDSNNLDTEDLIIFTNLLARFDDLATATEGFDRGNPFRRLSLVIKYRANIVCTAPFLKTRRRRRFCGSWPSIYGEKHPIRSNVLRTDVLLRSSLSYNIVFTMAIALTHAIGHVTLRPVLRAEWSDHGQTTGRGASWTPLWSRWFQ